MAPSTYEVTEYLSLTADDRVVPESDPAGHWLYAVPGQQIPMDEAKKRGLVEDGSDDSTPEQDGSDDDVDLSRANKAALVAEAEKRGLDTSGTNKDIRERIQVHDKGAE